VFVGNLPQYLSDKELLEFFGRTLSSAALIFCRSVNWANGIALAEAVCVCVC